MAFNRKSMSGNLGAGGGTRFFTYGTPDDRATVEGAGYFNEAHLTVKVGDGILVQADDGLFQVVVNAVDVVGKTVVAVTTMSEGGA